MEQTSEQWLAIACPGEQTDPPSPPTNSISIQYVSVRMKHLANNPAERSLLSLLFTLLPSGRVQSMLLFSWWKSDDCSSLLQGADRVPFTQPRVYSGEVGRRGSCFCSGVLFSVASIRAADSILWQCWVDLAQLCFSCLPCWILVPSYLCFGARAWISARPFNYISRLMSWHLFLNRKLGGIRVPESFLFVCFFVAFSETFHLKMRRCRVTAVVSLEYLYLQT